YVGPSGTANRLKLIHQTLVAGHAVAVAEALALCLMTDTDIETFYEIVCEGGGFAHSRYFENRVPRMRSGEFSPLFMLQFMLKDARLASDLVEGVEEKMPVLSHVVKTLEEGMSGGWGREDFSAVMHVLEKRAGKSVVKASL
ncbi:MAG: NAD-binding protein, partial [Kiloniellales bacterium]|nr:NAD-binding protein [Kiloniellales bacterium]